MTRYLLILQFPLLFLTAMLAGSRAYWVTESLIPAYLGMLLFFVGLHYALRRLGPRLARPAAAVPILVAGAVTATWIYRPMHLGTWEDGSLAQAACLAALGAISLAASQIGARISGGALPALAGSLAVLGALWLPGIDYPLIPLLFVGLLLLALSPLYLGAGIAASPERRGASRFGPGALAGYLVFLSAFDLSPMIWELQQDGAWAGHLAIGLMAAAGIALPAARYPKRILAAAAVWSIASLVLAVVWPDFELHPAHSAGAGLGLGAGLTYLARHRGAASLVGSSFAWGLGMALRLGFAQFGVATTPRLVLVLPALPLLWRAARSLPGWPSRASGSGLSVGPSAALGAAAARPAAELALLVVALAADLWWLRHLESSLPSLLAQGVIVLVVVTSMLRRRKARIATRAPAAGGWRAWIEPLAFTLLAGSLLAGLGAALRTEPFDELRLFALSWPIDEQVGASLSALSHALMQQAALLGLVWPASREIFGDRTHSYALAAAIFGAAHLPNPKLAAMTFVIAWLWILLYQRGASVAALVLSHAVLAPWAYAQLPERTLHDLHVGRKAVVRGANYRMLEREESRRLLARICSTEYDERAGGSDAAYVAAIFPDVLGRAPSPAEVERWAGRARRRTRCSAAKMLVMSAESVARTGAGARATGP